MTYDETIRLGRTCQLIAACSPTGTVSDDKTISATEHIHRTRGNKHPCNAPVLHKLIA